jgi:hypothetical protein
VDGHTVEIQERVSAFPQQYMMGVTEWMNELMAEC